MKLSVRNSPLLPFKKKKKEYCKSEDLFSQIPAVLELRGSTSKTSRLLGFALKGRVGLQGRVAGA